MSWGLALCGGGVRCGAHLGVLRVLLEAGYDFPIIAGSSSGAVAGAMYALGMTPEQMERELQASPPRVFGLRPGLCGLGSSGRFHRWLRDLVGGVKLEELPRQLIVTATDIANARPYLFTQGDLAEALYASSALPGLFSPLAVGEALLADGGLLNPLPVEPLRDAGAERLVGVYFCDGPYRVRHVVHVVARSFHTMMFQMAQRALAGLDLLIEPQVGHYSITDARNLSACVQAGEVAAQHALQQAQLQVQQQRQQVLHQLQHDTLVMQA